MLGKSKGLGGLVTAIAVAAAVAAFAVPASAAAGSCTPPKGADSWYCAALSLSNARPTDRLVDDYFRDTAPVPAANGSCPAPEGADSWYCTALSLSRARAADVSFATPTTNNGIVDDSWRSPFVMETSQSSSSGFNWDDFGIGAAVAVGAMLLALGIATRFGGRRRVEVRSA